MSDMVRIWKMILLSVIGIAALVVGYNIFETVHADQTALIRAQIESTPNAAIAAQARAAEAKAMSDKAMFEEMSKRNR